MANPLSKRRILLGYLWALHDQLEREFVFTPEELRGMSSAELRAMTKDLAGHLENCCPDQGRVKLAKANASSDLIQMFLGEL